MYLLQKRIVFFYFLSLIGTATNNDSENNETLVKTILVFRHGLRAPIKMFHIDQNSNEDHKHWPDGFGNLVQTGKWQMFTLGQQLRKRYKSLFRSPNSTITEDLRVVTTNAHRCFMSASYLLAGLYPASSDPVWSEKLDWHPVPVLFASPDKTSIVGNGRECPYYSKMLKEQIPGTNNPNISYLVQHVSNHTTLVNVTDTIELFSFIDYIIIKSVLNLQIPSWISNELMEKFKKFYTHSFHYLSATPEMSKFIVGLLIQDIIFRFKEVIYQHPANSKMFLYAGHDVSLHTLSKIMGFHLDFLPTFGASLIFEVHRFSSSDYRILLRYSEDYSFTNVKVWTIPNCEKFCPVGKFVQIVEEFFVDNWQAACNL